MGAEFVALRHLFAGNSHGETGKHGIRSWA